ncbi:hypothetical protein M655_001830 [Brevibacillus sp. NSP2.1]|uniref:hypothetical protein n=1 Tax=Brevibacillus sp. NSP2.1 TaxID=3003229 RepID=UPI001397A660|nr:hypothetical protein [Brevibacillus sp. NSP2.1]QHZ54491.1 hypothetical protein M655_001830 [Brevibacillus sp. NSP2.1]
MFKKKSIAILCTLSLLAMLPSLSFAKEDYSESLKLLGAEDQEVVVNIAEEAQGMVTKEQIEQIVEQAGDAKSITIHKVGKNTDDKIKPMYLSDVVKRVERVCQDFCVNVKTMLHMSGLTWSHWRA